MKKLLKSWWAAYAIVIIISIIVGFSYKEFWYASVTVIAGIFHLFTNYKMKWEYIEITDEDGYPGICRIPGNDCKELSNVRTVNAIVWIVCAIICAVKLL